jgi:hypothetical protein
MADQHSILKGDSESSINAQNQFMRSQPWYAQYLASIGQNPASVRLNDSQRTQLTRLAQQNGMKVDEGAIEIDPAGNFNPRGHKLRNAAIIAGAAAGGILAAPAIAGAVGGMGGIGGGGYIGSSVAGTANAALEGSAAATAAGTAGTVGTVGKIANIARSAAPILSQAAGSRATAQAANDRQRLDDAKFEIAAPGVRMKNAAQANLMANAQPWKTNWSGPGSGLKPGGGYSGATGGYGDPNLMSPDIRQMGQKVLHDQIMASLNGTDQLPDPGHSSAADNILGYGAMGASILGGMRR